MPKDIQATHVRLPADLHERLRRASFETRESQNSIIIKALEEYLASREEE